MASKLEAELLATCNALGYLEDNKYQKDPDCLEALKDLIRYLKHDDDNSHDIRRFLGQCEIVKGDLLPLLTSYWNDKILFDVILRLLINLTNPVLLLFNENFPEDKLHHSYFLELLNYLQKYKKCFTDEKVFAILTKKLGDILKLDWEHRHEDDKLTIERILIFVRNILHIPITEEKRTDNDANTHDQILWALHLSGFEDLLLYLASCDEEDSYSFHVLEIISLMFREQDPQVLASAGMVRSHNEKQKDEQELLCLRQKENLRKQQSVKKFIGSRHSRFGGTYIVQNMKSISNKTIITHRPLKESMIISFDSAKDPIKLPRNRQPMEENEFIRRSTLSIRLFLKEFCTEFLINAYNPLMKTVKSLLMRQVAASNDETYYLWSMKFFMEFNRCAGFQVKYISETMSLHSFHYVQTQIDNCREMFIRDKKKLSLWSRRLHIALNAYKELLLSLTAMDQSSDESVRNSAKIIKGNIFYSVEYRELPLILIHSYDELKMSKKFLRDLVELIHIFFKMIEKFTKQSSQLIIEKKKKSHAKRKKAVKQKLQLDQMSEANLEEIWNDICNDVSLSLQNPSQSLEDVMPFDPISEMSLEQQKSNAMYKIHEFLKKKQLENAINLFRAARNVWPEDGAFGMMDIKPEEEFIALREILFADLNHLKAEIEDGIKEEQVESDVDDEETEANENLEKRVEQNFSFPDFIKQFATHRVIKPYCQLFQCYQQNTSHTNHCIVKMFHRIAWDCKMPGFLFQVSVFRIFQKILDEQQYGSSPHKELAKFATYILQNFFALYKTNHKMCIEVLFWKNSQEVYEMENGYGTYKERSTATKQLWTEEQEDELRRLYEEYKDTKDESKDVIDLIVENMIDQSKTRRQVMLQLKRQNLLFFKPKKEKNSTRVPVQWNEEEEMQLRLLYEQHKDTKDILQHIMDNLAIKRPKHRIIEKLLELNIISDRKSLYKKRKKMNQNIDSVNQTKTKKKKDSWISLQDENSQDDLDDEQTGDDDSDTESKNHRDQEVKLNPNDLLNLCLSLVNTNKAAILWIKESFLDVANDRDEDDDLECVPLVPLSEEMAVTLEDDQFKSLLRATGVRAPQNEQETYWRIPSTLNSTYLRKLASFLEDVLNGTVSSVEDLHVTAESTPKKTVSVMIHQKAKKNLTASSKTFSKKKQKRQNAPKINASNITRDENNESSDNETLASWRKQLPTDSSNLNTSVIDNDTSIPLSEVNSSKDDKDNMKALSDIPNTQTKKRTMTIVSSDEEDDGNNSSSLGINNSKKKMKRYVVESDDE